MDQIELAYLMQDVIENWARESGKLIDIVINEVSRALDIPENQINKLLKLIDSPFVDAQNKIVGFIDGELIKRTTYHMIIKRIFENVAGKLIKKGVYSPSDASHTVFLQEAMYQHSRNKF